MDKKYYITLYNDLSKSEGITIFSFLFLSDKIVQYKEINVSRIQSVYILPDTPMNEVFVWNKSAVRGC